MSREALVLLVCCCDFRDGAERLMPSKSLRNAVMLAFPGLFCILRMCAPRRAAAVVRPRGHEKSADRRRRILISRLLIIRALVPRRKSLFPAYFKGFPAVSPLIPSYPAFLKYPVSPHLPLGHSFNSVLMFAPPPQPQSSTMASGAGCKKRSPHSAIALCPKFIIATMIFPPRPTGFRVFSKKDITPLSFYFPLTMQCFLPDAPTAPGGRPAIPRAAS